MPLTTDRRCFHISLTPWCQSREDLRHQPRQPTDRKKQTIPSPLLLIWASSLSPTSAMAPTDPGSIHQTQPKQTSASWIVDLRSSSLNQRQLQPITFVIRPSFLCLAQGLCKQQESTVPQYARIHLNMTGASDVAKKLAKKDVYGPPGSSRKFFQHYNCLPDEKLRFELLSMKQPRWKRTNDLWLLKNGAGRTVIFLEHCVLCGTFFYVQNQLHNDVVDL